MKRRALLMLLVLWLPAAFAADHPRPQTKPIVEFHGVGIVNRVERNLGMLNISHGPVPFAGWEIMTRDLRVKPRELLNQLQPGMTIRFRLEATDQTSYAITALQILE